MAKRIPRERVDEVVAVHCDAFFDYPTMRFVLDVAPEDYPEQLATLIGMFQASTDLKGGTFFGVEREGRLIAAADAVHSASPEPAELVLRRETTWEVLGPRARERYEAYSALTEKFTPDRPHHYLSMLGVRRTFAGAGQARPLLEAVHALSLADPTSTGVALETETAANVPLYRHFGYELVGHARIDDTIESWGFFRPNER